MVNKLWHKKILVDGAWNYDGSDEEVAYRNYIQELIDLYCPDLFKIPEDITPDNFQQFLEVMLRQYQYYNLTMSHTADLFDAIETYFYRAYIDEFPNTFYPSYPKNDRRGLALFAFQYMEASGKSPILPEEVPFLLECLNVPSAQVIYMKEKLEKYFSQFDFGKRCNVEIPRRWEVLIKQRQEALQKRAPLPIKPMGIDLDLCYRDENSKL